MTNALLVVDVDHRNGWKPDVVAQIKERQKVKVAIERVLEDWRARGGIIAHIILGESLKFSGQEAQYCVEKPGTSRKENFFGLSFGRIFRSRLEENQEVQNKGTRCLVCDAGDEYRLAEFVGHKCRIEPAFVKTNGDAFTNEKILEYLHSMNVRTVFLIGCNTGVCVRDTGRGALLNGFDVVLLADASFPLLETEEKEAEWVRSVISQNDYRGDVRVVRLEGGSGVA